MKKIQPFNESAHDMTAYDAALILGKYLFEYKPAGMDQDSEVIMMATDAMDIPGLGRVEFSAVGPHITNHGNVMTSDDMLHMLISYKLENGKELTLMGYRYDGIYYESLYINDDDGAEEFAQKAFYSKPAMITVRTRVEV
jgi:hypothetical protein